MKRVLSFILGVLCVVVVAGCILHYLNDEGEGGTVSATKQIYAMDTVMSITAYGKKAEEAVEAAAAEILRLDALLSTGEETSEISLLNAAGTYEVSEDTAAIIEEACVIYEETGGLFDITVYPVMQLWGFPTQEYYVPADEELAAALELVDGSLVDMDGYAVTLGEGQQVDLGGIAKGYTSNRVMEIFEEYGIKSGMVSLGGNIQTLGKKTDGTSWKIGIQNPDTESSESVLLVLEVEDRAVITSGGYERYFEEDGETYIHIIDPRTGYPADTGLESVSIISENGMLADALSTSLFIMGLDDAIEFWRSSAGDFEMIIVTEEKEIYITEGIASDAALSVDEYTMKTVERQAG